MESCIKGIADFVLTENRADVIHLNNNITLYDGTYNGNLDSVKASIDVISRYSNRKIAVLGDMLELGEYDETLHREIGKFLIEKQIDVVLLVGSSVKYIYDEIKDSHIESKLFPNNTDLEEYLLDSLLPNDVVLIKASHGMKLNEIVNYLKEEL